MVTEPSKSLAGLNDGQFTFKLKMFHNLIIRTASGPYSILQLFTKAHCLRAKAPVSVTNVQLLKQQLSNV